MSEQLDPLLPGLLIRLDVLKHKMGSLSRKKGGLSPEQLAKKGLDTTFDIMERYVMSFHGAVLGCQHRLLR